jgi:signal transduction histidine kinase
MTADELIRYLSWSVYLVLFAVAVARAVRQPRRPNVDVALFFSASTAIIAIGTARTLGYIRPGHIPNAINSSLLFAFGYLLLRLADDFAVVPDRLMRAAALGLALAIAGAFMFTLPRPAAVTLAMAIYLIVVLAFAATMFVRQSRRSSGVTHRRLRAVANGTLLLVALIVLAVIVPYLPRSDLWQMLSDTIGLASAICFFVGFAPPLSLRRAWQEPEVRAFLGRAASLPRMPETESIIRELEMGACMSLGATGARIGLWNETEGLLRFPLGQPNMPVEPSENVPAARAFREQRPVFEDDMIGRYPKYRNVSQRFGVNTLMAAPITAGEKRIGVLAVYAQRPSIFVEDDLALVQLLADQAAVILESRGLIDEAARVRAIEEATRLKEDFLSAAAHDLKTPLTTLVARAQYLERRALRSPDAPADLASNQLLVGEGQRLKRLVLELLDASRAEQGQLVGERSSIDLAAIAREVCLRHASSRHQIDVAAEAPVVGEYDPIRIEQLLENLIENAVKYSPSGGTIRIAVGQAEGAAQLGVRDSGIGIPPRDLPHIFERFYRAGNVDDRRFAGMGLGLFICKAIVEQHGGRIWATSHPGQGSTFHVSLPLAPVGAITYA